MRFTTLLSLAAAATLTQAMGIPTKDITVNTVDEMPGSSPANEFCTNCVHAGAHCNIGEGNCYASEHASCTYCGGGCGMICVVDGIPCEAYCG